MQTRQWQNIVGYHFAYINPRTYEMELFFVPKKDMEIELSIIGSSAHMTAEALLENKKKEKRITIKPIDGNEHYERWKLKYKVDSLEEMKKLLNRKF